MADGYLNFDTKINEKGFNEGVGKLSKLGKSGLSIVSKAMTGAVVAVGTAAGAIIKSSLGVVANMEQQVGGVETLFMLIGRIKRQECLQTTIWKL